VPSTGGCLNRATTAAPTAPSRPWQTTPFPCSAPPPGSRGTAAPTARGGRRHGADVDTQACATALTLSTQAGAYHVSRRKAQEAALHHVLHEKARDPRHGWHRLPAAQRAGKCRYSVPPLLLTCQPPHPPTASHTASHTANHPAIHTPNHALKHASNSASLNRPAQTPKIAH
jgi:hypothetical protein